MGIFAEYLNRDLSFEQIVQERKAQLRRISAARDNRDVLVYAADLNKPNAPISIDYSDLLPLRDQVSNLNSRSVDVILETPGGSGEVAEDFVELLHGKYERVGIIVPGWAKSAGTIIAMAGDEILMDSMSAVGPIDAQMNWQGKVFSADALIEGIEKIKAEVDRTGTLNRAYIPILQGISPGEIQSAENALKFARVLVADWLVRYKFAQWTEHHSEGRTGQLVTEDEKRARADEIATELANHRKWLTHGRSIKMEDLQRMRIQITDYSAQPELGDAISRYYTLLQMTFATNIYKVFETATSQIYRQAVAQQQQTPAVPDVLPIELECGTCKQKIAIQAHMKPGIPYPPEVVPFPVDNKLKCPNPVCKNEMDLTDLRRQIEAQTKKRVVQ